MCTDTTWLAETKCAVPWAQRGNSQHHFFQILSPPLTFGPNIQSLTLTLHYPRYKNRELVQKIEPASVKRDDLNQPAEFGEVSKRYFALLLEILTALARKSACK